MCTLKIGKNSTTFDGFGKRKKNRFQIEIPCMHVISKIAKLITFSNFAGKVSLNQA
jgi:hypothetical protein